MVAWRRFSTLAAPVFRSCRELQNLSESACHGNKCLTTWPAEQLWQRLQTKTQTKNTKDANATNATQICESPEHEYLAARSSSKRQEATCDNTLSVWESLFPSPRPSKGRRQSRTRAKVPTNSLVRQNRQSCGNLLQCLKTTLDWSIKTAETT